MPYRLEISNSAHNDERTLRVNDYVRVRERNSDEYFHGTIRRIDNIKKTCSIAYDRGDCEAHVSLKRVKHSKRGETTTESQALIELNLSGLETVESFVDEFRLHIASLNQERLDLRKQVSTLEKKSKTDRETIESLKLQVDYLRSKLKVAKEEKKKKNVNVKEIKSLEKNILTALQKSIRDVFSDVEKKKKKKKKNLAGKLILKFTNANSTDASKNDSDDE